MRNPDPNQNVQDSRHFNKVQQRAPGQAVSTTPSLEVGPKPAQPPGMG